MSDLLPSEQLLQERLKELFRVSAELRDTLKVFNSEREIEQDVDNLSLTELAKHVQMIRRIRK